VSGWHRADSFRCALAAVAPPRALKSYRGSGWREAAPLTPPPGIAQADKLMDAQDARDRQELIERKAKEQALLEAAESK
jgi:hypothetical protein